MNTEIENITDILDNMEIPPESVWKNTNFKITLAATVICFFIFLFFFVQVILSKTIIKTPNQWFCEQLKALWIANQEESKTSKEIYFQLVFVIKWYLDQELNLKLQDKTDSEVIKHLENHKAVTPEFLKIFKELLKNAYHARFVQEKFDQEQIKKDLSTAKKLQKLIKESKEKKMNENGKSPKKEFL